MRGFGANLHGYVKLNSKEVSEISGFVNNFLVLKNYEEGGQLFEQKQHDYLGAIEDINTLIKCTGNEFKTSKDQCSKGKKIIKEIEDLPSLSDIKDL